jgi:hypothetical protein
LTTSTIANKRTITINTELFELGNLNIYELMAGIILSSYTNEPVPPDLRELAQLGRMNDKQATNALQGLLDKGVLPNKIFRMILGNFGDDRLSWAAKGLLLYLKEHPDTNLAELFEKSKDDETSVRFELEELKRYGYLDELQMASSGREL